MKSQEITPFLHSPLTNLRLPRLLPNGDSGAATGNLKLEIFIAFQMGSP